MSRILRRPMFRGGPVDSRGTGITSGLDDSGYADGGNVIPKRGLVDGPGGYAGDFNYSRDTGLGRFMPKFNEYAFREPLAAAYNLVGVPLNKVTEFVTGYNPGFSGERLFNLDMKNRKPDTAEFFGMDTGAKRGFTYQNESQQKIEDQKLKDTSLKDDYELRMQKLKDDYEKRIEGLKKSASPDLTEEEEITKQTELYQKLLGGDEARAQAGYDALLAAAPAFFKGKNLREAAPQVLESINKSGAFDKPRDIKQAAAQLAIQRRILMDKAGAEARAKMAELGIKKPSTLTERYAFNIKSQMEKNQAAELAIMDTYGEKYKPFAFSSTTAKVGEVYKFPKDPKKPNMGFYYGEIKDLSDPKNVKINPLPL
jgi:hypothetical protein